MRQARTSLNRALSVLRMLGILAVHPALRLPEGLSPTRRQIAPNHPEKSTKKFGSCLAERVLPEVFCTCRHGYTATRFP